MKKKNKIKKCGNCKKFLITEDGAIICTFIGILLKSPDSCCKRFVENKKNR